MASEAHHYLSELRAAARRVSGRIEGVCRPLEATALGWRPEPKAWSAADVVGHLVRTSELYLPRLRAAIERGRARGGTTSSGYRPRRFAGWFIRLAGPDSARPVKAPRKFQPTASGASPEILDRFLELQIELEELMELAGGCDLNRNRFGSPITPLLRFSVGEALTLLVRHAERHAGQIERLLALRADTAGSA